MSLHFNQTPRRKAEFTKPPNHLKAKVGSGGLDDSTLDKAEKRLQENDIDFEPLANLYLEALFQGLEKAKDSGVSDDVEYILSHMIYPAMQLKANGGMFHYNLITAIADKLIQFLEVLEEPDIAAIEIVLAFHTTMRAVIQGKLKGHGGNHGSELLSALESACVRYFSKHKNEERQLIY